MKTSSKSISLFAACLCPLFIACLWDYDTIQMERQEFPTALELITGKFLRHSDVYYQWRIEDRTPKLSASPSAELFDDLAVAHEKLGNLDQEFDRKYYDDPMLSIPSVPFTKTLYSLLFQIAVIAVPTVLFLKWWNRRRRHAQQPAQQPAEN